MIQKIISRYKNVLVALGLLLFVLPTVIGSIGPGFYSLHDDMHVAWLYEMNSALQSGQIPPRWVPDLSFGFGYPLFNFVYPLPYYVGEIFYLIGFSLVGSIKVVFALSLILSVFTMYVFLRRNFGILYSFAGAILYVYTPYRAVDVYVRGAIGEALAFVLIPLVAWSIDKLIKENNRRNYVFTALSVAALIISHNIASFMVLPVIFLYGLVLVLSNPNKIKLLVRLFIAGILGLLTASYFWIPALIEKKYMVADTIFNYWDHFPFLKQLIVPFWGYGTSTWGPADGMSFQIGLVNLSVLVIIVIFGVYYFLLKKFERKMLYLLIFTLGVFFLSVFLMNIRSSYVWQNVPLIQYFQFPWRFLIVTTFITSFGVGLLDWLLKDKRYHKIVGVFLLLLTPLTIVYFRPEKIMPERTDNYYFNRFFAVKTPDGYKNIISPEYLDNTEEYLRLPLGVLKRPTSTPLKIIETEVGRISVDKLSVIKYQGKVVTDSATAILFHNYYFPGWIATINNRPVAIEVNKPYGDIKIPVEKGESNYEIKFTETPIRVMSNLISLITIATLLAYFIIYRRQSIKNVKK